MFLETGKYLNPIEVVFSNIKSLIDEISFSVDGYAAAEYEKTNNPGRLFFIITCVK